MPLVFETFVIVINIITLLFYNCFLLSKFHCAFANGVLVTNLTYLLNTTITNLGVIVTLFYFLQNFALVSLSDLYHLTFILNIFIA